LPPESDEKKGDQQGQFVVVPQRKQIPKQHAQRDDPEERDGAARLDGQFWRATVNPSERYVLSLPGTTAFRLRAEETGLANLLHVGDHTFTGVNAGCVEAAVMSGMNAAQHLCRHPAVILGDVLPRRGPWGAR
jgi:uncharacterized protein with NAD-binding domain and iron-sulfur cluster